MRSQLWASTEWSLCWRGTHRGKSWNLGQATQCPSNRSRRNCYLLYTRLEVQWLHEHRPIAMQVVHQSPKSPESMLRQLHLGPKKPQASERIERGLRNCTQWLLRLRQTRARSGCERLKLDHHQHTTRPRRLRSLRASQIRVTPVRCPDLQRNVHG